MNSASTEHKTNAHPFPTVRALIALTVMAVMTGAIAFFVVQSNYGAGTARSIVGFAVLVVWVASVLAIIPVALFGPRGVTATMVAYLSGMAGRLLACVAAALIVVQSQFLPAAPTLLSMGAAYLGMVIVETAIVGRYLRSKDSIGGHQAGAKPRSEPRAEVVV
jgi:hypothetical protein